jgi:hypothetical protein
MALDVVARQGPLWVARRLDLLPRGELREDDSFTLVAALEKSLYLV